MTDHHCKELYRCYKCVNIDYAKNYTDVSYNVDFNTDEDGNRQLDCKVNSKQDAENICECDKRFAENIAATVDSCNVRFFRVVLENKGNSGVYWGFPGCFRKFGVFRAIEGSFEGFEVVLRSSFRIQDLLNGWVKYSRDNCWFQAKTVSPSWR